MATLTTTNVVMRYSDGESDLFAVYALRGVTTGDTINLSTDFVSARQAFLIGTTVIGEEAVTVTPPALLTIPAGLSNDSSWLVVWGAHA